MTIINALFAIFITLLFISGCLLFWGLFQIIENATKCPSCGKLWAAEKSGENLMGIFRKNELRLILRAGFPRDSNYHMAWYEKYKVEYKCKYCSHEWTSFKLRKQ